MIVRRYMPSLQIYIFISAKTASVINPFVFAVSHPKYREALAIEVPCLGIGKFLLFFWWGVL